MEFTLAVDNKQGQGLGAPITEINVGKKGWCPTKTRVVFNTTCDKLKN
jgi:hypothetical protein